MIDYVKGAIAELEPAKAVIDCHGVGYDLNISLTTYAAIQGREEAKLYVYESIREDAWVLYGFQSKVERAMFLLLISVSGVGAGTARVMLSSMTPAELAGAIAEENVRIIKQIKGIGPRTAERIIVELRDKVQGLECGTAAPMTKVVQKLSEEAEEAISALTMLGFAPVPSKKVVEAIVAQEPGLSAGDITKRALKELR